ncbi:hypothetical protein [Vagococcus penaei]|uniref:hypothetical protein n=1 Tax=Vagococcus penaei TaxID=633807 RepID=UPI0011D06FA4|nr:hypothetical protein [Vagococcus penaei]
MIQTIITSAWGLSDNRQQLLNSATLGKHVRLTATSSDSLIQSLHSRNLSDLFNQLNKSTPDYLPIYAETTKNKYQQYREEVIECVGFDKKVVSGKLRVSWKSNFGEQVSVPVIVYAGTRVNLNGKELDKSRVILSDIGVPTVQSSQGENWLELDYPKTHFFNYLLLGVIGWWIGCLWYLMRKQRDAKRMRVPRPSLVSSVILKGQIDEIDE